MKEGDNNENEETGKKREGKTEREGDGQRDGKIECERNLKISYIILKIFDNEQ